jgi:DNA-directed RNA polymerase specialized sigma24 family protein
VQDDLAEAVTKVIAHPEADIDAVIERARVIGQRAAEGEIGDVVHYATKALFGVARKERRRAEKNAPITQPPQVIDLLAGAAVEGSPGVIEAQVLLRELLGKLSPVERDVFVRHVLGWKHSEIAKELGISLGMSWFRLQRARERLASLVRA